MKETDDGSFMKLNRGFLAPVFLLVKALLIVKKTNKN